MVTKYKATTPDYKTRYPGIEAYHIPNTPVHGFPWEDPSYVPFVPVSRNLIVDRDHDEKPELELDNC